MIRVLILGPVLLAEDRELGLHLGQLLRLARAQAFLPFEHRPA